MATSTIPAVKQALQTLLSARVGMNGAKVTWAVPNTEIPRDWISLDDVTGRQTPARLGRQARDEEYTVQITVTVVRPAVDTPASVAERAFDLVAEIEDQLRETVDLELPDVVHSYVTRTDLIERNDGEQREARALVDIFVKARI